MRPHIIWTIFRKEITEALRDRVTLAVVILLPLLLYPLVFMGMAKIQKSEESTAEKRISRIAIWGDAPARVLEWLQRTNIFTVEPGLEWRNQTLAGGLEEASPTNSAPDSAATSTNETDHAMLAAAARDLVASQKADAVLVVRPGFADALEQHGLAKVTIFYDSVRPASQQARDRLADELSNLRGELVAERERDHALLAGFARALETRSEDLASRQRKVNQILGNVLPLLLIVLSAMGALYAAIDLTAGEKDRMTMQTLLCAPVSSIEIVAGKFFTIWVVSLVAALANAASLSLTMGRLASAIGGLSLSPMIILLVLPCLLLVTCTIAATFLAVAVLARDAKDAGHFLSAAFMIVVMPMAVTLAPGIELNAVTSFLPMINIALLIKMLFLGEAKIELVFLALVAATAYAALALLFAARVFSREQILLGGKGGLRSIFLFQRRPNEFPSPGGALVLFVVVLVSLFYVSMASERLEPIPAILVSLYGGILLPGIAWTLLKRFPLRETFALRAPHWRSVLGSVLIGATGAIGVGGLALRLMPPPDTLMEGMQKLLLLGDPPAPLWLALLVLAISPALCEELIFRGLIFRGFQKMGPWPAILISALLFGIAHASIYRLLPTFGVGLLMGYTLWRSRSIYCSILIHALNNGLVVAYVHWQARSGPGTMPEITMIPWSITFGALGLTLIGLALLRPPAAKENSPSQAGV